MSDSLAEQRPANGRDDAWTLAELGWSPAREAQASLHPDAVPGRVVRADRGRATVAVEGRRVLVETTTAPSQPVVGDWVMVGVAGAAARIVAVLPRETTFTRATALSADSTSSIAEQILAANIDLALVFEPATDPNPRRLERELLIASSATRTLVVVTKVDLVVDIAAVWGRLEPASGGRTLLPVSAVTGEGLEALRAKIGPRATVACFGASGVGKSTLINALLGEERMATAAVREDDQRGRHTTVTRELFPLGDGVTVIDMPGLRTLSTVARAEDVDGIFGEIAALVGQCRFGDCAHEQEPGCAVQAAIEDGSLERGRLESYRKIQREAARRRRDPLERKQTQSKWRAINKGRRRNPTPKDRWR